jgi:hypothetical protein
MQSSCPPRVPRQRTARRWPRRRGGRPPARSARAGGSGWNGRGAARSGHPPESQRRLSRSATTRMRGRSVRNPSKKRMSCSFKNTTGATDAGVGTADQLTHEGELARPLQLARDVVRRHEVVQRAPDRLSAGAGFWRSEPARLRTEHGADEAASLPIDHVARFPFATGWVVSETDVGPGPALEEPAYRCSRCGDSGQVINLREASG